ncbi:hypothetical protein J6590_015752 [Homalodisca vitripennis]|nr:hypothetical protein J6590_015752 [Homalodisca vitripennis]
MKVSQWWMGGGEGDVIELNTADYQPQCPRAGMSGIPLPRQLDSTTLPVCSSYYRFYRFRQMLIQNTPYRTDRVIWLDDEITAPGWKGEEQVRDDDVWELVWGWWEGVAAGEVMLCTTSLSPNIWSDCHQTMTHTRTN